MIGLKSYPFIGFKEIFSILLPFNKTRKEIWEEYRINFPVDQKTCLDFYLHITNKF